jgi:signal peptidase I
MAVLSNLWRQNKGLMLFIGLMLVFRSAVADWNYIPSSSMNPTLVRGDRVVVNKLAYNLRVPFTLAEVVRWAQPQRGDVITFDSPQDEVNLIKRVVAVAGDVIEMHSNVLSINGQQATRTLVDESRLIPSEAGVLRAQVWRESLPTAQGVVDIEVARLPSLNRFQDFAPVQVPVGTVMVMGDSRDNSNDSRFIGFIDVHRITGQAVRVALSHDPDAWYAPRADRWWHALHL